MRSTAPFYPHALLTFSAVAACFLLHACTASQVPRTAPAVLPGAAAPVAAPVSVIESIEPWSFQGTPGRLIRTRWYRFFTTETDPILLDPFPEFLERCLHRYTTEFGPLPHPPMPLDTFLMADRRQWMRLTRQMMGDHAATYLLIERGGFSSGGRALLWTIGRQDTLAIAAHEGWHQYTQRTFRDELPTWLEEGIGVYMEGLIIEHARPLVVRPSGWANLERYDHLARAAATADLMPLASLLSSAPGPLLHGGADAALTYYAQVWALILFLLEHDGGVHRQSLHALLVDAAAGRLVSLRAHTQADDAQPADARHDTAHPACEVFHRFFDHDLARAEQQYVQFVMAIVQDGNRRHIAAGRSPLSP